MATNKSVSISVRLPQELVDKIDKVLTLELHSNRPDLIVSAVRFFVDHIIDKIVSFWVEIRKNNEDRSKAYTYHYVMEALKTVSEEYYNKYSGDPCLIVIRIPEEYQEHIERVSMISLNISVQSMIRLSVANYIEDLEHKLSNLYDLESELIVEAIKGDSFVQEQLNEALKDLSESYSDKLKKAAENNSSIGKKAMNRVSKRRNIPE